MPPSEAFGPYQHEHMPAKLFKSSVPASRSTTEDDTALQAKKIDGNMQQEVISLDSPAVTSKLALFTGNDLLHSSRFDETSDGSLKHDIDNVLTKRPRLSTQDMELGAVDADDTIRNIAKSRTKDKGKQSVAKKRSKSPKKKYTTITSLATSAYFGEEKVEPTPTMQFLSATQAQLGEDLESIENLATAIKGRKRASKAKTGKTPKVVVLSPQSAMEKMDSQEVIFGNLSQLARDESPTLMRDTIRATKLSQEDNLMSDPILTQCTAPTDHGSVNNTPSRRSMRNTRVSKLWTAASRDEDDALLQVETLDLFDTPAVKNVFAGKDVLTEPCMPNKGFARSASPAKVTPSLRGGTLSRSSKSKLHDSPFEMDDFDFGSCPQSHLNLGVVIQARALHTTPRAQSPRQTASAEIIDDAPPSAQAPPNQEIQIATAEQQLDSTMLPDAFRDSKPLLSTAQIAKKKTPAKRKPKKPSYNGFTTDELGAQIKSFGFKPIKKREKMIQVLEECWESKYGPAGLNPLSDPPVAPETSHGDFLANLHDVANRPKPKLAKKPRKVEVFDAPEAILQDGDMNLKPTKAEAKARRDAEKAEAKQRGRRQRSKKQKRKLPRRRGKTRRKSRRKGRRRRQKRRLL